MFEYVGQTAGSREVEVRARVTGILLKRNFQEGAPVEPGPVAVHHRPGAVPGRARHAPRPTSRRPRRGSRRRSATLARLKPLLEARAVSQKEYDDAASAEQIARADLKGAQARRAEARLNLGYTRVEAPISGVAGAPMFRRQARHRARRCC